MIIPGSKLLYPCLVLIGLSLPGAVSAQEFCSEPVPPYCVDEDSEFDTMLQVNRCEDDLNDYRDQLDEYEKCIAEQLSSLRKDLDNAQKRLGEVRKEF